jgi:AAA+ superfamily predicted ATPase
MYKGKKDGQLRFTKSILSSDEFPSHETFDNLSHQHVNTIRQDLASLKDLDYYKRTGLRRKKSYLFWGDPGCGKTSTVMAMALYDQRHIIEINFEHIKGDDEFQELMNISSIEDVTFTKANIILFFEEIVIQNKKDLSSLLPSQTSGTKSEVASAVTSVETVQKKEKSEQLEKLIGNYSGPSITSVLSRLDGVGNYNGLVIVAATNNKDQLDQIHPAICRDQRLTPVHFTFCRKEDIIKMVERFYDISLTENEIVMIPDQNARLSGATIRTMLDRNRNSRSRLLKDLGILAK